MELLERLGDYSLLRFKLDTGRTHQIRVHCAHMNPPVVGDPSYSRCRKLPIELPGQALLLCSWDWTTPISGERMVFEAPLPAVMEKLLTVPPTNRLRFRPQLPQRLDISLAPPWMVSLTTRRSMLIRVRCRRVWLASLMRSIRNEIVPLPIRRRLIVVDLPRAT